MQTRPRADTMGDVVGVAAYNLPVEAVEAALAYYERNKAIIDNRRMQNYWSDWDEETGDGGA